MPLKDLFKSFSTSYVKQGVFHREVESAFYTKKKFKLPQLHITDLEDFIKKYPFAYFSSEEERYTLRKLINEFEGKENNIQQAEDVIDGYFNFFGLGKTQIGTSPRWNYDYLEDYEWENEIVWKKNYLEVKGKSDLRVPWEISRFHQLMWLGKAYLHTSDDKYTQAYFDLIMDFVTKNPFCIGVNWVNVGEVSTRLLNIVFSFGFFLRSNFITKDKVNEMIDIILQHAVFIENSLEYNNKKNHRFLMGITALAITGLLFKDSQYGKRLLEFSRTSAEESIRALLHNDGTSFEQSIPYHSITLECFYLCNFIFDKAQVKLTKEYSIKLFDAFQAQASYLRKDNSVPAIGDFITSRIVDFNFNSTAPVGGVDFSFPLPIGAVMFNDGKLKSKVKQPTTELLLLMGVDAVEKFYTIKSEDVFHLSNAFPSGGHYIFKNGGAEVFIKAGDLGLGAPSHNDIFTFEVLYDDIPFIVDSGSAFSYGNKELRTRARTVKTHNSVCIDNELLAEFEGQYKIKMDLTKPKIFEWHTNNQEDYLVAQHYAYTRLIDPVICKRTFHLQKDEKVLKIKDEFFGGKKHQASFNVYLHPEVKITKIEENNFLCEREGKSIEIIFHSPADDFLSEIEEANYSEAYRRIVKTNKISVTLEEHFPAFIKTEIKFK